MRSLERGLAVLAAINRRKLPSVVELARDTRLPRPTVYRLLETLSRAGFVTRTSPHDRYCLAARVRTLSDGFVEDDWIAEIAAPLMKEFTARSGLAGRADDLRGRPHAGARDDARSQHPVDRSRHGRAEPADTANGRRPLLSRLLPRQRAARDPGNAGAVEGAGRSVGARTAAPDQASGCDSRRKATRSRIARSIPKTTGIAVPIRLGTRMLASPCRRSGYRRR